MGLPITPYPFWSGPTFFAIFGMEFLFLELNSRIWVLLQPVIKLAAGAASLAAEKIAQKQGKACFLGPLYKDS